MMEFEQIKVSQLEYSIDSDNLDILGVDRTTNRSVKTRMSLLKGKELTIIQKDESGNQKELVYDGSRDLVISLPADKLSEDIYWQDRNAAGILDVTENAQKVLRAGLTIADAQDVSYQLERVQYNRETKLWEQTHAVVTDGPVYLIEQATLADDGYYRWVVRYADSVDKTIRTRMSEPLYLHVESASIKELLPLNARAAAEGYVLEESYPGTEAREAQVSFKKYNITSAATCVLQKQQGDTWIEAGDVDVSGDYVYSAISETGLFRLKMNDGGEIFYSQTFEVKEKLVENRLDSLSDVCIENPVQGETLVFDAAAGGWVNGGTVVPMPGFRNLLPKRYLLDWNGISNSIVTWSMESGMGRCLKVDLNRVWEYIARVNPINPNLQGEMGVYSIFGNKMPFDANTSYLIKFDMMTTVSSSDVKQPFFNVFYKDGSILPLPMPLDGIRKEIWVITDKTKTVSHISLETFGQINGYACIKNAAIYCSESYIPGFSLAEEDFGFSTNNLLQGGSHSIEVDSQQGAYRKVHLKPNAVYSLSVETLIAESGRAASDFTLCFSGSATEAFPALSQEYAIQQDCLRCTLVTQDNFTEGDYYIYFHPQSGAGYELRRVMLVEGEVPAIEWRQSLEDQYRVVQELPDPSSLPIGTIVILE